MSSVDAGFSALKQKQNEHDNKINLLQQLNGQKSELKRLLAADLIKSIADWKSTVASYLTTKGMVKEQLRYTLANVSVQPVFPDTCKNHKLLYCFELLIEKRVQHSQSTSSIHKMRYEVEVFAPKHLVISDYHVPQNLENDIATFSDLVKNYEKPAFTFNVKFADNVAPSTLLKDIDKGLINLESVLNSVFDHFFTKVKI